MSIIDHIIPDTTKWDGSAEEFSLVLNATTVQKLKDLAASEKNIDNIYGICILLVGTLGSLSNFDF